MKIYQFSGHLSPLPPGINLPMQISGEVCLPADLFPIKRDITNIAAELARGTGLPSSYDEDQPRGMRRRYWLDQLEQAHQTNRDLAIRLADIAKKLSPSGAAE